jgi:hypothetical protein
MYEPDYDDRPDERGYVGRRNGPCDEKYSPPPFNRCDEPCRNPDCRNCSRCPPRNMPRAECSREPVCHNESDCYEPCLPPIDDYFLLEHLLKKYNIDKLKLICHLEKIEICKEKNRLFAIFYCRFPSQKVMPFTDQWLFFKDWICKFCPQFEIDKCDMENYLQGKLNMN